ncbi:MAG: hypothetical protein JST10_16660 [Bacteroidetes bacterium]|nr:hypothetical protein [Bacteroidota bacterium]MBS1634196.1 hypothetical protein [Bacteroidota bacterium]
MKAFPFSKNLFWDTDIKNVDLRKHKRYVIERVITRGSKQDFEKLLTLYTRDEISTELKKSKELDPKTRHFCSWYFNIPINELHASSFYR